jgi:hypothetical protein
MLGKPSIPQGGNCAVTAGEIGAKTDSPLEVGDAGNG